MQRYSGKLYRGGGNILGSRFAPTAVFFEHAPGMTGERGGGKLEGNLLDVSTLATLAWLLTVFCADTFHLDEDERRSGPVAAKLTFAARQTVQARAPRTTGALELHWMSKGQDKTK